MPVSSAVIIALHKSGMKVASIASQEGVTPTTVYRHLRKAAQNKAEDGRVNNRSPSKLTSRERHILTRSARKDRRQTLGTLSVNHGIHKQTARKLLLEKGIQKRWPTKKPFLTDAHRKNRRIFCKAHRNWQYREWERVIWSDEASIQVGLDTYPRWLFRSEGEKFHRTCLKAAFKTSRQSIMVWACFHGDTKGTLIVIEKGSIDSLVYQNTLREGLLGLIEEEEGILETQLRPSSLIFMQDNAPIHKSNSTLEFLRSFNISPMAWPPNSPDLNPIENIWALFKKEFHSRWSARRAISSAAIKFPEMKTMLIESWEALPVELFKKVVDSMPRRVRLALKASGGPINY